MDPADKLDFNYSYFKGIGIIKTLFGADSGREDVLIIREEYSRLHEAMKQSLEDRHITGGFALTGQPGIGSYECWF